MKTLPLRAETPLKGIGLFVLATFCFSGSDALAKYLSHLLPATEITWIRYIVFVVVAVWIEARSGRGRFHVRRPVLQVARGIGLVASAVFTILALRGLPMAEATTLAFMSPVFITILSIPVLGEVVGLRRWIAVGVGMLGVLVVARPGAAAFHPAAIFVVMSSLSWAMASVLSRKIAHTERATTTVLWAAVTGLVLLTLLMPAQAVWPDPLALALAVVLGVVASGGQYFMVLAYRHAGASLLAPFSYLQLIWATGLGWLVFGNWPDVWTLVGAGIIAGSGLYVAGRERVRSDVSR